MATYNQTPTKLVQTYSQFIASNDTRRAPLPLPGESFYFNQDHVKAKIVSSPAPFSNKSLDRTSVHITDQRLVVISQPQTSNRSNGNNGDNSEDEGMETFQVDLRYTVSLRTSNSKKHKIILHITVQNQWEPITLHLTFKKKDHGRRDSFKEYLHLVMATWASRRSMLFPTRPTNTLLSTSSSTSSAPRSTLSRPAEATSTRNNSSSSECLPTYLQAISDMSLPPPSSFSFSTRNELPPAYC